MVAANGTVKDKYSRYWAYGAPEAQTVSTGQAYRYTGKPFDEDGGIDLYYYGARYYDPYVGRFTTIDPLRQKYPGWAPYVYALGNPMRFTDPDGMWSNEANALKFVEKAMQYDEKPYSEVDCSQLVDNALRDMAANGIQTEVNEKLGGKVTSSNLLENATNGKLGLSQTDYSSTTVKAGDLIAYPGHVEVVTQVNTNGTVNTVGSSDSKHTVVKPDGTKEKIDGVRKREGIDPKSFFKRDDIKIIVIDEKEPEQEHPKQQK